MYLTPLSDRAAAYRELVLVHEAGCMPEFVQNDAFLWLDNCVSCTTDLTQVHRGLVGVDEADFIPDVGPSYLLAFPPEGVGGFLFFF